MMYLHIPDFNRHVVVSILMFQDTVRYCMASAYVRLRPPLGNIALSLFKGTDSRTHNAGGHFEQYLV